MFNKTFKSKDIIGITLVILALVAFLSHNAFWKKSENKMEEIVLKVGGNELNVKVADSDEERYKGLSGYSSLSDSEGMLFVHSEVGRHQYVMRGMNFDLDFIFIKDDQVVDIAKNVSMGYKGIIQGATDYDKILEVPAGWCDKKGVKLGDKVVK